MNKDTWFQFKGLKGNMPVHPLSDDRLGDHDVDVVDDVEEDRPLDCSSTSNESGHSDDVKHTPVISTKLHSKASTVRTKE